MRQKVIRSFLVLLVLLIWGAVIARAMERPIEAKDSEDSMAPDGSLVIVREDTSAIVLQRDPFLEGIVVPRVRTDHASVSLPDRVVRTGVMIPTVIPAPLATIQYLGFVRNGDSTGATCVILRINGREQVMAVGKELNGIRIVRASQEQVAVELNGAEELVPRSKMP